MTFTNNIFYSCFYSGLSFSIGEGDRGGKRLRLPPPVPSLLPPVPFCELSPASRLFSTNLATGMLLLLRRPI